MKTKPLSKNQDETKDQLVEPQSDNIEFTIEKPAQTQVPFAWTFTKQR